MSRFIKAFLLVSVLSGVLVGCGGGLGEDYMMTSLRAASRERLYSPGFRFGFDNPNVVAAHKDVAIIREGNIIEFFTGEDLEGKLGMVEGKDFVLGARKLFTPFIHFTVDFLYAGGDTINVNQIYDASFPMLVGEYSDEGFEDVELHALTTNRLTLKRIKDTKFKIEEGVVRYEEINEYGEPTWYYTIHLPNVRLLISDPSDEMQLLLKALINENLYFEGGVSYGNIPTKKFRRETDSGGKVKIDFFHYGGRITTSG